MKSIKELMELRKQIKIKKPDFIREDAQRKRVPAKWKRPVGIHSKVRHGFQGHIVKVKPGFGSPRLVKGLDRSGLKPILVNNINELLKLTKQDGAILSSKLGKKKKLELIKKCIENNIKILNLKNPQEYFKLADNKKQEQKKIKQELKKKKEEKAKETEKKEVKEDKLAEKIDIETKKELDKVLTKKES